MLWGLISAGAVHERGMQAERGRRREEGGRRLILTHHGATTTKKVHVSTSLACAAQLQQ